LFKYYAYWIDGSQIRLISVINLLKEDFELIHWCNDMIFTLRLLTLLKCTTTWLYGSLSLHVILQKNKK
jgi:hypothetical protein